MKKIEINTTCKKMLADVYTPVGIYLRLRDQFRDCILLESADHHEFKDNRSFIGINAVAGIEISSSKRGESKLPGQKEIEIKEGEIKEVPRLLWNFMQNFTANTPNYKEGESAQGFFGYTSYDAVQFFDSINLRSSNNSLHSDMEHIERAIPLIRYRLYQYIIIIDHSKDELFLCENEIKDVESDKGVLVELLIKSKDIPEYPFEPKGDESSNMSDDDYKEIVKRGIAHCHRGDVFQIVLSRRFQQKFIGDEFNVYRALRSINPSPYLFFLDYGDYKLMGSSPETHLIIRSGTATVNPIAGTFKITGNDEIDKASENNLKNDKKENAEHVMLVDLARNDLSRFCDEVPVMPKPEHYKQVKSYNHVMHLVSKVTGKVKEGTNPFLLLGATFPAGTLSGTPKYNAIQLIDEYEPSARSYYGGAIGFIGFNGSCNHAIMIRTFLSQNNTLTYQAGAGIVEASKPENELQEVNNKLHALKKAIDLAKSQLIYETHKT